MWYRGHLDLLKEDGVPTPIVAVAVPAWVVAGLYSIRADPPNGVTLAFVVISVVGLLAAAEWAFRERVEGRPGEVAYRVLISSGWEPAERVGEAGILMVQEGADRQVLLTKSPDLKKARVAIGRLTAPDVFEEDMAWSLRYRAGHTTYPSSLRGAVAQVW